MKNLGAFRSSLFGHSTLTVGGPHPSVSIIGGLVEPDVVSVEQPTIRETEVFGLTICLMCFQVNFLNIFFA